MPEDIGSNEKLNKWLAAAISVLAALPLYMGIDSLTFLRPEHRGFAYICLGIAAVILGWAAWIWTRPPINAATLKFRDSGIQLWMRQVFRGEKEVDLDWSDIKDVTKLNGGLYGGRSFIIRSTQGKTTVGAAWFEQSSEVVFERLVESANEAGFKFVKAPLSVASIMRERWDVRCEDSQ